MDSERLAFIRQYYRRDAADPSAYDLLLNSSTLSFEQAADVVAAAYRTKFGP
jgi:cytidylate kinase